MAGNPVAANTLLLVFLLGGLLLARQTNQELTPKVPPSSVFVGVAYPGASPEEVEQGIILPVEDSVRGLSGVAQVMSMASSGYGQVIIPLEGVSDMHRTYQEIVAAVNRIPSFPQYAMRPSVSLSDQNKSAMSLVIYGRQDYAAVRALAEKVQDELRSSPSVSGVQLGAGPGYQISIEVQSAALRAHSLSLDGIAYTIRELAENYPAGEVTSRDGTIMLRTSGRMNYGREFASLPVAVSNDGAVVKLGDIAEIQDGFDDNDPRVRLNGQPAIMVDIYKAEAAAASTLSREVREYLAALERHTPPNISAKIWYDAAETLDHRMNILRRSAVLGLILVLIPLALFLEVRLAAAVTLCIPVAVLGTFLTLPVSGASINMISLFAFVVMLGIVIDQAIAMGERIYRRREEGLDRLEAAQAGVKEMVFPLTFATLITAITFFPMFFLPGQEGRYLAEIPRIALAVSIISLINILFILPAHLARRPLQLRIFDLLNRPKIRIDAAFNHFLAHTIIPILNRALANRYLVVAGAVGLLLIALGLLKGGYVPFAFYIPPEEDSISISGEFEQRSFDDAAAKIAEDLARRVRDILDRRAPDETRGVYSQIAFPSLFLTVGLRAPGERKISRKSLSEFIARDLGQVRGITRLSVDYGMLESGGGSDLQIVLVHKNRNEMEAAAKKLADLLSKFKGVSEINDGFMHNNRQFDFTLTPQGRSLGLTAAELGRQLRSMFYGSEVLRQLRGRNEVTVLVRLPSKERRDMAMLDDIVIRLPSGGEAYLRQVASIRESVSDIAIQRSGGNRMVLMSARVDPRLNSSDAIYAALQEREIPNLMTVYPGLSISGGSAQMKIGPEYMLMMIQGPLLIAALLIYSLLAIAFRSYFQPALIVISVPFGVVGSIIGHLLLGSEFTITSVLGLIALSGVVLNTSLLLMLTTNSLRQAGFSALAAMRQAEMIRFRSIMLTTLTTFLSVAPLMLERSPQVRPLVPMAISLGFGVVGATFVAMALMPALYLIADDFVQTLRSVRYKQR